jgi:hypothetical protein
MTRFIPAFAAAMLMASSAGGASAQVQGDGGAQLQGFTHTPTYQALIRNALAAIPPAVFQQCPALVSNASQVTVLQPVAFAADGVPTGGRWKQSFPVSGCGNDTILNLYFTATADEKINTMVGHPGTTRADLTLQRDAILFATIGAGRSIKDCKSFVVRDTKFEGYGLANPATPDPGPGPLRPWWESWTLAGCGQSVIVPLDFEPDGHGTRIVQPGGAPAH